MMLPGRPVHLRRAGHRYGGGDGRRARQPGGAPRPASRRSSSPVGSSPAWGTSGRCSGPIASAVEAIRRSTGRTHFRILDAFAGSGVVSHYLKAYATELTVNDLEPYAAAVGHSFLANASQVAWEDVAAVSTLSAAVEGGSENPGFIERLYAPRNEGAIEPGERVFYTCSRLRSASTSTARWSGTSRRRSEISSSARCSRKRRSTPTPRGCSRASIATAPPGSGRSGGRTGTRSVGYGARSPSRCR